MRISVVVPAHNEENYIGRCLEALTHQTHPPHEIIVVDNHSSDRTVSVVGRYPGVSVVTEPRVGLPYARECGFDHATGDVIARCDADCVLPPDWIARIHAAFSTTPCDALTGPIMYEEAPSVSYLAVWVYIGVMYALQHRSHTLIGPNFAITATMWKRVRHMVCVDDPNVHEDQDLALHISAIGGTVKVDRHVTVHTSGRRVLGRPWSFFGEYPVRMMYTLFSHRMPISMPRWLITHLAIKKRSPL